MSKLINIYINLERTDEVKKNTKTKKGFTLIELIVVISIVLILSSLLVPKVLGYQDKARKAKVVNTSRQIFDAAMESYTEQEGNLVTDDVTKSIKSVTDADISEGGISVDSDKKTATVKFKSDKKDYSVAITADSNQFVVKDGDNEIYKNK